MKKIILIACIVSILSCKQEDKKFVIQRGLNLSHWLSQTKLRGQEREKHVTKKDFEAIAQMGFDHIRLPIDEEQFWDEQGNRHEDAFKLLHFAIKQCEQNNLRVIVDLHTLRSHHFNNIEKIALWNDTVAQQKYIGFWKQLSSELEDYSNGLVAYEPLNEAVADNPEDWNNLINWVIVEIRKLEPKRTIIMGSNRWQTTDNFKFLRIPKNDPNIILSFHFYSPFAFTHYQAPWSEFKDLGIATSYPGWAVDTAHGYIADEKRRLTAEKWKTYNTKEVLEQQIMLAVEIAQKHKLQLFCGEFGCYPTTTISQREAWYNDVIDIFNKHNIAWSHWNYKNDFPIVDSITLQPNSSIQSILMKKK